MDTRLALVRAGGTTATFGKIHIAALGIEKMLCGVEFDSQVVVESHTGTNICPVCEHVLDVLNCAWDAEQRDQHFTIPAPVENAATQLPPGPGFYTRPLNFTVNWEQVPTENGPTVPEITDGPQDGPRLSRRWNWDCGGCVLVEQIGIWDIYEHDEDPIQLYATSEEGGIQRTKFYEDHPEGVIEWCEQNPGQGVNA